MMHLTSVLLPAPLPPSRACIVPGRTVIETLSSATSEPNRLVMPMADSPGAVGGRRGGVGVRRLPGRSTGVMRSP